MRRTPRRIPEHLVPLAGTPFGLPTPAGRRPLRRWTPTQAMTIDTERLRELGN
jgi:hypothetical protein